MNTFAAHNSSGKRRHCTGRFNNRINLPMAALAMAVSAINYTPLASAEAESDDQQQFFLEEIIVTARRREESLQDIPVAVSALSADQLEAQGITELNDLGTQVPSLRVSNAGISTNDPIISIRGQRPSTSSLSLDAAAPIYFNDVVMTPSIGTNLAMYDLESVQVLKGPQGTLFGRNSTGGAILITPKAPGETTSGYLEVEAGNHGLWQFEGAADLPVNENLSFRVAARSVERDGYQDNIADNALGGSDAFWDEDSKGVRLTMALNLDNGLRNTLVLAHDKNDMIARAGVAQAYNFSALQGGTLAYLTGVALGGDPDNSAATTGLGVATIENAISELKNYDADEIATDLKATENVKNTFASNATEFSINDNLTVKNILGYRKMEIENIGDVDGTALPLLGYVADLTSSETLDTSMRYTEAEQFSNEIQLIGTSPDDRLDWIVGAYWYQMQGSQGGYQWALPTVSMNVPSGDVDNEARGLFAEGTYTFNDTWALTAGLRKSWDKREVTVKNAVAGYCTLKNEADIPLLALGLPCERTEDEDFDKPTGRVSLNYTPRDGMLLYASVSSGYRAGGFNLRGTDNATLEPFDEETVLTYELGHKTDWQFMNKPMRSNLAIYLQKYKDIQKTQGVVSGEVIGTSTINAAKATIKGLEFDIWMAVTQNLSLSFAYSLVDTEYDEWDYLNAATGMIEDRTDATFTYIPKHSATASATYDLPVDESVGEMKLMASVYWQDEMDTAVDAFIYPERGWAAADLAEALEVAKADSYAVWNLRYSWNHIMGSNFDFSAYVNNASDEEYVIGGLNVIDTLGWATSTYGAPRTMGASMRYNF